MVVVTTVPPIWFIRARSAPKILNSAECRFFQTMRSPKRIERFHQSGLAFAATVGLCSDARRGRS
jgi:hypothetical protein